MIRTRVGYSGGSLANPTYTNLGNHTETFEVDFDPSVISYKNLLDLFWASHNPHAGQWSVQYKSAVFYRDEIQKRLAEESAAAIEQATGRPVTTEILEFAKFWRAEDYHQKYYLRHEPQLMNELERYYKGDARGFVDSTLAARFNGYAGRSGSHQAVLSEIDSYGLSAETREYLLEIAPTLSDEAVQACGVG